MGAALAHNVSLLNLAASELKSDREVVLAACRMDGYALNFCNCPQLRADREVVLTAVANTDQIVLCSAAEKCREDREIILAAVRRNPFNFYQASEELQKDPEVLEVFRAAKRQRLD